MISGHDVLTARRRAYGTDYIQTGLVAQALGALMVVVVGKPYIAAYWLGWILIGLGTPVLLDGCVKRVKKKGYPAWVAATGLASFPGVLALILLPDQYTRVARRKGFEVIMPKKVSTTWVVPEAEHDPLRWRPRSWGGESLFKPRDEQKGR